MTTRPIADRFVKHGVDVQPHALMNVARIVTMLAGQCIGGHGVVLGGDCLLLC